MQYRTLGQTGIQVAAQCLGAMMFGLWGNRDHDECVRDHPHGARRGHQLHRHRRRVLAGRVGGDRRQGAEGPPRRRRARDEGARRRWAKAPNRQGNSRRWIRMRGREQPAPAADRLHRPVPDPPARPDARRRRDARRAHRPRARGQGARDRVSSTFPAEQIVEAQWVAERRGRERFRCEQPPYSILARGIERAVLPTCARYGMGVIVWSPLNGGWLTGKYKRGQD